MTTHGRAGGKAGARTASHGHRHRQERRHPGAGDNGAAGWVVIGPAGPVDALSQSVAGELEIDGEIVARGDNSAFVIDPLRLVQGFLHQALARRLLPESANVVLLGSVTPYHPVARSARVLARFDGLLPAELQFTD